MGFGAKRWASAAARFLSLMRWERGRVGVVEKVRRRRREGGLGGGILGGMGGGMEDGRFLKLRRWESRSLRMMIRLNYVRKDIMRVCFRSFLTWKFVDFGLRL